MLIQGSGGMASAVANAFQDSGFEDGTIVARNRASGTELAQRAIPGVMTSVMPGSGSGERHTIGMSVARRQGLRSPEREIASAEVIFDAVAMPRRRR